MQLALLARLSLLLPASVVFDGPDRDWRDPRPQAEGERTTAVIRIAKNVARIGSWHSKTCAKLASDDPAGLHRRSFNFLRLQQNSGRFVPSKTLDDFFMSATAACLCATVVLEDPVHDIAGTWRSTHEIFRLS